MFYKYINYAYATERKTHSNHKTLNTLTNNMYNCLASVVGVRS